MGRKKLRLLRQKPLFSHCLLVGVHCSLRIRCIINVVRDVIALWRNRLCIEKAALEPRLCYFAI